MLLFVQHGDWPIAFIIFTASVVVPVSKILALLWLCHVVSRSNTSWIACAVFDCTA
ncbi:paraquat-inducible protein A [Oceanimonas sp. NS1]|nr:paraquat-inducible protein A [Oceanimonas sp. NS1]